MGILEKIYAFLAFKAKEPETFGIFHLSFLAIIAVLTIIVCKKYAYTSERTERKIAFFAWIGFLSLEIYKQLMESVSLEESVLVFSYNWSYFPFQLCSSPLYVLPLIACLPNGKLRESLTAFASTVILFAGVVVCIYPGNVFVETLGINLQTLIWHGSQVWLGAYFLVRRFASSTPPEKRDYFSSSIPVFLIFTALAIFLNISMQNALNSAKLEHEINMFFISPYFDTIFPILTNIKPYVPYPLFALSYVIFVVAFSYLIFSAAVLITKRTLTQKDIEQK